MQPAILILHPQLRAALPRALRSGFNGRFCARLKTTKAPRASKQESLLSKAKESASAGPRIPTTNPTTHAKTSIRKGPPERILIYHGGTGPTIFLGVLRLTSIFLFGVSCLVVAPAFAAAEYPWYLAPAVAAGGAIPMFFISYTAAPWVNFVHLALPVFARRSRDQALQYAKNLPPTATLYLNTMKFTTIPRQTEVRVGDLIAGKSALRPVSFQNQNPMSLPWWQGKALRHFYTAKKSKPGRASTTFYPELWEHVYKQIQNNAARKR